MNDQIKVLDHGYVRLIGYMGDDLAVVNAARASFAKRSEWEYRCDRCNAVLTPNNPSDIRQACGHDIYHYKKVLSERDAKLLRYLAVHGHSSPFRHCTMTFEVKAPLMVARQWWKYVVGGDHTMDGWNETSRRYVEEEPEFYVPTEWRGKAATNKQGSEGVLEHTTSTYLKNTLDSVIRHGQAAYHEALTIGVAAEQARLMLPSYAMYTQWQWTASLQSVAHFLAQRLDPHAQYEIRCYARAVRELVEPLFPVSIKALVDHAEGASE